jgi:peroxiredoxin
LNRRILAVLLAFFCFFVICLDETNADGTSQIKGTALPKVFFKDVASGEALKYLDLRRQKNFSLNDIPGSVLVIELFSTYCTTCPKNVPIMNDVFTAVEKDPRLRGKVKVFGIGIGNTRKEVEDYRKAHGMIFPVLTDYDFAVHDALGNPRVPCTMFVKKSAKGKKIVDIHQGVLDSAEAVLKKVRMLN